MLIDKTKKLTDRPVLTQRQVSGDWELRWTPRQVEATYLILIKHDWSESGDHVRWFREDFELGMLEFHTLEQFKDLLSQVEMHDDGEGNAIKDFHSKNTYCLAESEIHRIFQALESVWRGVCHIVEPEVSWPKT